MRQLFIFLYLIFSFYILFAQKPPVDSTILDKWPYARNPYICNDGNYAYYTIENRPTGNATFVIQSTNNLWKKEFLNVTKSIFSDNSKEVVFQKADSLYFLQLGSERLSNVYNITSFKYPTLAKGKWVAYKLKDHSGDLVLLNLLTKEERRFLSVADYNFDNGGKTLLIRTEERHDSTINISLVWVNLLDGAKTNIWSSNDSFALKPTITSYTFDEMGKQLAFMVRKHNTSSFDNYVWYYRFGMQKSVVYVENTSLGIEEGLRVDGYPRFSRNGHWIFFELRSSSSSPKPKINSVKVDIWSYKDKVLQPEQMRELAFGPQAFSAVINTSKGLVIRLERDDERVLTPPDEVPGDFIVVAGKPIEMWWNISAQPSIYLMSLANSSRICLKKEEYSLNNFSFSPQGRYLVYFDTKFEKYFSYDILEKRIRNLTEKIPTSMSNDNSVDCFAHIAVGPIAGWLAQDSALFVYDNYDIWKIDPTCKNIPINITNSYGFRHHLKLRFAKEEMGSYYSKIIHSKDTFLLTAFAPLNKYNGFYRKLAIEKVGDPELLFMGPYTFFHLDSQMPYQKFEFDEGMAPIKARDANCWIVKRESFNEAPNYFVTMDFKNYNALSKLRPQEKYNWLTAELVNWKQFDGTMSQGVLYKPENFDRHKRYPVIFNYYEQLSNRLYEFPEPEYTHDNINIPWFVSNGYLVFTPDIHYSIANKTGKITGECAYNSVVSAASYLSTMPFVDSKRLAIQGHSFGGGETNYLITHTHIFAAAAEVAGDSDPISAYLTLAAFPDGRSWESYNKQPGNEIGQGRYGVNPWLRPDLYKRNSAVLRADKVSTPLLIMHNKLDNQIPWRQGLELYMALRRLGKRVWMLQYDEGSHGVFGKDAVDYTIRLTQFFNYYLKNNLPPKWMTEGVRASQKGINSGYEVDTLRRIP